MERTTASYDFFPGMRRAMIQGYENGALPFKEVTPVITTRLTRAGRKKLSVKLRKKRQNPPSDVLASLEKAPPRDRVRRLTELLQQLETRFRSSKFLARNFVIFDMFRQIVFCGAEIEDLKAAGFGAVIKQDRTQSENPPWLDLRGSARLPEGYKATRSLRRGSVIARPTSRLVGDEPPSRFLTGIVATSINTLGSTTRVNEKGERLYTDDRIHSVSSLELGFSLTMCLIELLRATTNSAIRGVLQHPRFRHEIHKCVLWTQCHKIVGTVSPPTRVMYLRKFGRFCSYLMKSFKYASPQCVISAMQQGRLPQDHIISWASCRLSNVATSTMAQDISALNHCCYAFTNRTLLELCPPLQKTVTSLALTFRRQDDEKSAAQPMEWRYVAALMDFVFKFQTSDLHQSWREALRFIAWFGPRTREARKLKLQDVFLVNENTSLEHIRVIIRGAKTGTTKQPDQVLTVPRFSRSTDHCPVNWYKKFLRVRHPRAKYLFTDQHGQEVAARTFTQHWRDLFDAFVPDFPALGNPSKHTFYSFRTSLVVYLAVSCDFSYEKSPL